MSQMTSLDPSPCAESKEKWNDTSVGKSSNGSIAFYVMEKKNVIWQQGQTCYCLSNYIF
jgi:hypothetical protein